MLSLVVKPLTALENNNFEILSRILSLYSSVDAPNARLIFDCGNIEPYRKNEIIFHQKRFDAFEYFQLDGVSHRFNTDQETKQITTAIYQDEAVITPHFARTTNGHSIFSLQALTDCLFLKVPAGAFRDLMNNHQAIRAFGQAVVEREFIRGLNFEVMFRSNSAKDRLLYFRKHYSGLENLIPHTIIASFLGITPVSFSRLRNELASS